MRTIRYRSIADDLRARVRVGEFARSSLLPSESELSEHYDASRVTIRRSLEVLRDEGLLESRQGFGWTVADGPVHQELDHLETLERQLAAAGVRSGRQILSFGFVAPPRWVSDALGHPPARESAAAPDRTPVIDGSTVLEVRRLNLADGVPFARVTVWCPEDLGAGMSRDDVERVSFLEQLPVQLGGAKQSIGAALVTAEDAAALDVAPGSPVLVAERVTSDEDGRPVLVSEHVFPAHRTRFVADLTVADGSLHPVGLRLVD